LDRADVADGSLVELLELRLGVACVGCNRNAELFDAIAAFILYALCGAAGRGGCLGEMEVQLDASQSRAEVREMAAAGTRIRIGCPVDGRSFPDVILDLAAVGSDVLVVWESSSSW